MAISSLKELPEGQLTTKQQADLHDYLVNLGKSYEGENFKEDYSRSPSQGKKQMVSGLKDIAQEDKAAGFFGKARRENEATWQLYADPIPGKPQFKVKNDLTPVQGTFGSKAGTSGGYASATKTKSNPFDDVANNFAGNFGKFSPPTIPKQTQTNPFADILARPNPTMAQTTPATAPKEAGTGSMLKSAAGKVYDIAGGILAPGITHEELRNPQVLKDTVTGLPKAVADTAGQVIQHPIKSAQSAVGGATRGISDFVTNALINLTPTKATGVDRESLRSAVQEKLDKYLSPDVIGKNSIAEGFHGAGEAAPLLAAGGVGGEALGAAGEAAGFLAGGQTQHPLNAPIKDRVDQAMNDLVGLGLFKAGSYAFETAKGHVTDAITKAKELHANMTPEERQRGGINNPKIGEGMRETDTLNDKLRVAIESHIDRITKESMKPGNDTIDSHVLHDVLGQLKSDSPQKISHVDSQEAIDILKKYNVDIENPNPTKPSPNTVDLSLEGKGEQKARAVHIQDEKTGRMMGSKKPDMQAGHFDPVAMGTEIKHGLSPQTASPEAQAVADNVREAEAKIANQQARESYKYKDVTKHFEKLGNEENIANISHFERTGKFQNAPEGYSEFYKESLDNSHKILQSVYGEDKVGYVENYVRRQFKFGSAADEAKATEYLTNKMNSLSANKSNLKGRVLDMPLDEALADMKGRGINVKPATTNPEALRQWSVANAQQAATYADTWQTLKDKGQINYVKAGEQIPEGLTKLNDRVAEVFYPTEKGMVKTGQYYADENVARILNNTISRGLSDSPTFKGAQSITNAMNQLQLGLSEFHLMNTAVNAGISDWALGLRDLISGNISKGAGEIGRGALPGVSFYRDMVKGKNFINELTQGNVEATKFLEEKFNPAGGRLKIDQQYTNQAYKKMMEAFKSKTVLGTAEGVARIPSMVLEKTAAPLMEYAIPRVKIGAFMDMANSIIEKMPNGTPEQMQRAYAKAWDSIDNRFGQLVYDNLFWNKTAKDLAMVSTRSVGWNLGTVRELGGGIADLTKTARGRGISDRTLYAATLPIYAGMIGAVYQYLHTGKTPQELKDYFYPQNGATTKQGNPDRASLPTYMKDVYAYSQNPLQTVENKVSPLLSMIVQLAQNKNYYGDMIRNPEDPKVTQLKQVGEYGMKEILPFSIQGMMQEGVTEQGAEQFAGFTKAPAQITRTPEQNKLLSDIAQKRGGFAPRTPEQVATGSMHTQAEALHKELKALPPYQANLRAEEEKKVHPELYKALKSIVNDEKLGMTYNDRLIKQLGIQNGERAKYIDEYAMKLGSSAERNAFITDLQKKSIVNDKIIEQIKALHKNGN